MRDILSRNDLRERASALSVDDVCARRRLLLHDLRTFLRQTDELPLLRASPERDSLLRWRAILCGPRDTPWESITLQLRIDFPPTYPSAPPVVTCVTPVFHPNVDPRTGQICASVLTGREWTPRDGLMEVLITLQHAFLCRQAGRQAGGAG